MWNEGGFSVWKVVWNEIGVAVGWFVWKIIVDGF